MYKDFFQLLENKDHLISKLDLTDEQKDQLKAFFKKYPNYESKVDWNKKNLSWSDFEALLELEGKSKSQAKKKGIEGLTEGKDYKILDHGTTSGVDWIIYYPLTHLGSQVLASTKTDPELEGKWCISMNDSTHWNIYTTEDTDFFFLFFLANKKTKGSKFAISRKAEYFLGPEGRSETKFVFSVFSRADNNIAGNSDTEGYIEADSYYWTEDDDIEYRYILQSIFKKEDKLFRDTPNYFKEKALQDLIALKKEGNFVKPIWGIVDVNKIFKYEQLYNLSGANSLKEDLSISLNIPSTYQYSYFPDPNTQELFKYIHIDWDEAPATTCIKSIDLSQTHITTIPEDAFYNIFSIENISLPSTLEKIEANAFTGTTLRELDCSKTQLKEIEEYAFNSCTALEKIYLPKTLTFLHKKCFQYTTCLSDVYVDMPLAKFKQVISLSKYDSAVPDCFEFSAFEKITLHTTDIKKKFIDIWPGTPGNPYTSLWLKNTKKEPTPLTKNPEILDF